MRLNKYIAKAGVTSRRKADILISQEMIQVNGKIISDFSYQVKEEDIVTYKGKVLSSESDIIYLLNKPKGYVCSNADTFNKKNVFELIDSSSRLFTVGRLDRDTTGALLITNNGDLSYRLTHPKYQVKKKYYATSKIDIENENLSKVKKGIQLDDGTRVKAFIKRLDREGGKIFWDIILTEGKNREIRRIFDHFKSKIISLHRYEFANINIKSLKIGGHRKLNKKEIVEFGKI